MYLILLQNTRSLLDTILLLSQKQANWIGGKFEEVPRVPKILGVPKVFGLLARPVSVQRS
jgi:hypothetical protein